MMMMTSRVRERYNFTDRVTDISPLLYYLSRTLKNFLKTNLQHIVVRPPQPKQHQFG